LLVGQALIYSGFINCLANLSFAPLHLNITSRMWQQVCELGGGGRRLGLGACWSCG
jgi:hypothetical protein